MKGTSRVKLYHELGLEKLSSRRWMRRLCHYYKLLINRSPSYLYSLIPQPTSNIQTRSASRNPPLMTKTVAFQNSFFKNVICEWNKIDINIRGFNSFLTFMNIIIKEIRPSPNSIFGIHNPLRLKFLTRFSMFFCHLFWIVLWYILGILELNENLLIDTEAAVQRCS